MAVGLVLLTLAVFSPVGRNDFVNYDDPEFITQNPVVARGLTVDGIFWAFTHTHSYDWEWHPVTWLSHMLDVSLFGLNPAGHHWMSLLIHVANVFLLFLVLKRMTGAPLPSGFVAALFAIHPLHVESVAWIAERKDLLSALFGLLTLWAYAGYAERRETLDVRRKASKTSASSFLSGYFAVLLFFTLSLMAKPMLVTLPFLLLLLDFWPLGRLRLRLRSRESKDATSPPLSSSTSASTLTFLFLEKLPLFLLMIVSIAMTFLGHRKGVSNSSLAFPLSARIENALVSYASYLGKMFWPNDLAVYYPHPGSTLPLWQVAGSAFFLLLVSAWTVWLANRKPYLLVGWLWYLGTLVPVIQIIQLGSHAMADRYTYIPLIGIFIMIAWGTADASVRWPRRGFVLAGAAGLLLFVLSGAARVQVGYWKDSIALFEHAIRVTQKNFLAHQNLGAALAEKGRPEEAIQHYTEALRIKPDYAIAHYSLGIFLPRQGRREEAAAHLREAIRINPNFALAHYALATLERGAAAKQHYLEAIRIDPDFEGAHYDLGLALAEEGRVDEAIEQFAESVRIDPTHAEAHYNLGATLSKKGNIQEAVRQYLEAIRLKPDYFEAHVNLGGLLALQGRFDEAAKHYSEGISIRPDHEKIYYVHYNLGLALEGAGKLPEAGREYSEALRIKPDFAEAKKRLLDLSR